MIKALAKQPARTGEVASPRRPAAVADRPSPLGNQAHLRRLAVGSRPLQARLEIGAVDDPLEREADQVANRVMGMPPPMGAAAPIGVQRKCGACQPDEPDQLGGTVQRLAAPAATQSRSVAPDSVGRSVASVGQPLAPSVLSFFEPRFGRSFAQVRVHTDAEAASSAVAVGAQAYTVGSHLVFAPERYRPGTARGDQLIAHELAHVVQQGAGAGAGAGAGGPQRLRRDNDGYMDAAIDDGYIRNLSDAALEDLAKSMRIRVLEEPPNNSRYEIGLRNTAKLDAELLRRQNPGAAPAAGAAPAPVERPPAPMFGYRASPAAMSGITLWYQVAALPHSDRIESATVMKRGPYRIVPNLRREADGSYGIVYFNAFRMQPGLVGPTDWNEYAIGPDAIDSFLSNVDARAASAAAAYMFGPPRANAVEGAAFVESAMAGHVGEAATHYKNSLVASAKDPGWWMQIVLGLAGGMAGPTAEVGAEAGALEGAVAETAPAVEAAAPAAAPVVEAAAPAAGPVTAANLPKVNVPGGATAAANDVAAAAASPARLVRAPGATTPASAAASRPGSVVGRVAEGGAFDGNAARAMAPAADTAAAPARALHAVPDPVATPTPAQATPAPATPAPAPVAEAAPAAAPVATPANVPAPTTGLPLIPPPIAAAGAAAVAVAGPGTGTTPVTGTSPSAAPAPATAAVPRTRTNPPLQIRLVLPPQKAVHIGRYRSLLGTLMHDVSYSRTVAAQADKWDQGVRPGGSAAREQSGMSEATHACGQQLGLSDARIFRPNWTTRQKDVDMQVDHMVELQVIPAVQTAIWDSFVNYELLDAGSNQSSGAQLMNNIQAERNRLQALTGNPIWQTAPLVFTVVLSSPGFGGLRWSADEIERGDHIVPYQRLYNGQVTCRPA